MKLNSIIDEIIIILFNLARLSLQVLLAWSLATGFGVIPKSVREVRIQENLDCLKVSLDAEDMREINEIETRHRYIKQYWATTPGQVVEDLWDGEILG